MWKFPGLFGTIARWEPWGRTDTGKSSSACTWLESGCFSRCTCVESDGYWDDCAHERPTTCRIAVTLSIVIEEMASACNISCDAMRQRLLAGTDQITAAQAYRVLGGLYVVVCPSEDSRLPVPVPAYFTAKRASCAFCAGGCARDRGHITAARESGAPKHDKRSVRALREMSLEVTSVTSLPMPL